MLLTIAFKSSDSYAKTKEISSFNDLRPCVLQSTLCSISDGHLWV